MKYVDARDRITAAEKLLREKTTTRQKFESIRTLIKGLNPTIDKKLASVSKALTKVQKVKKGKVIDLTLEHLPEKTDKDKKRKKAMLLFFRNWKKLKSEVRKISKELDSQPEADPKSPTDKLSSTARIAAYAKGPLGAITLIAATIAGVAILLQKTAVKVVITNNGCNTLNPNVRVPFSIPGISLPSKPIKDGDQAVAIVPPLKLSVDGSSRGSLNLSAYSLSFQFDFPSDETDIVFNSTSLIGTNTSISLGSQKSHSLVISCL